MTASLKYGRVLLKLSGEALQAGSQGLNAEKLKNVSNEIASVTSLGAKVALVIGGGNIIRGSELCTTGVDRVTADHMGMLATIINGIAIQDALDKLSIPSVVMSALPVTGLVQPFDRRAANKALDKNRVVIFVGGTGNPLVTTDSAAALRGIQINANIVVKATKVDGVFAADPIKNPKAERYEQLTYDEVLEQRLGVMDLNAILLCREHCLPMRVVSMRQAGDLKRLVLGENVGTLIQSGE